MWETISLDKLRNPRHGKGFFDCELRSLRSSPTRNADILPRQLSGTRDDTDTLFVSLDSQTTTGVYPFSTKIFAVYTAALAGDGESQPANHKEDGKEVAYIVRMTKQRARVGLYEHPERFKGTVRTPSIPSGHRYHVHLCRR